MATHAGFRDTQLYGAHKHYHRRYCIWNACTAYPVIDNAEHVLLYCPLHRAARERLFSQMRAIPLNVGLTMDIIPSGTQRVRFLLGSPPETTHSALAESPSAYR